MYPKVLLLLGLAFFSITAVFNFKKLKKNPIPFLLNAVVLFVIVVFYFEITWLFISAYVLFFLAGLIAIADIIAGKTIPETIVEKLKGVEGEFKWYDIFTWKPLLPLRRKFGNLIASMIYSACISGSTAIIFYIIAPRFKGSVAVVLGATVFVTYSLNIYRALKKLDLSNSSNDDC